MGVGYASPWDTNPYMPGTQLWGTPNLIPHYDSPWDTNPYVSGTQTGFGGMGYGGYGMGLGSYGMGYGMGTCVPYGGYGGFRYY